MARTRGGLYVPLHATLRGRVRWQVLDERGVPEVPRNPSGFAIGPAEGVEQPNLITNRGMDMLASYRCMVTYTGADNWRQKLRVGTGSTTPDVTDTGLASEVQSGVSVGSYGEANGSTGGLDAVNDVWWWDNEIYRLLTMSADRNLTEFAFGPNAETDVSIRELFRDEVGDPVTISLLNGKQILIYHTLRVELPAPPTGLTGSFDIDEYDAANALVSSTPYTWTGGWYCDDPAALSAWRVIGDSTQRAGGVVASQPSIFGIWDPAGAWDSEIGVARLVTNRTYARTGSWASGDTDPIETGTTCYSTFSWAAYTPGSYERVRRSTVPTATGNAVWNGWVLRGSGLSTRTSYAGFHLGFDSPATYTKVSTDTLRVGLVSSWARAAEGS